MFNQSNLAAGAQQTRCSPRALPELAYHVPGAVTMSGPAGRQRARSPSGRGDRRFDSGSGGSDTDSAGLDASNNILKALQRRAMRRAAKTNHANGGAAPQHEAFHIHNAEDAPARAATTSKQSASRRPTPAPAPQPSPPRVPHHGPRRTQSAWDFGAAQRGGPPTTAEYHALGALPVAASPSPPRRRTPSRHRSQPRMSTSPNAGRAPRANEDARGSRTRVPERDQDRGRRVKDRRRSPARNHAASPSSGQATSRASSPASMDIQVETVLSESDQANPGAIADALQHALDNTATQRGGSGSASPQTLPTRVCKVLARCATHELFVVCYYRRSRPNPQRV